MKRLLAMLFLVASSATAQISFDAGNECDGTPNVARGCLKVEAGITAFVELRDALTPDWSGTLTCSACNVASGFPGCVSINDQVTTTRQKAALAKLTCILRSHVVQQRREDAVAAAESGVDEDPEIGGGDPG